MDDHEIDRTQHGGTAAAPDWQRDRPGIILLTSHWLTWLGFALGITAVSTWLFVVPAEVAGHAENPYKGAVLYLILPFILIAGLALAACGIAARPAAAFAGACRRTSSTARRRCSGWSCFW